MIDQNTIQNEAQVKVIPGIIWLKQVICSSIIQKPRLSKV